MTNNFSEKANFIWQVADDILRGAFKAHEHEDAITLKDYRYESIL